MSRKPTSFRSAREKQPFSYFSARLPNWKQNGSVVVWVHTKSGMSQRLMHLIPYIGVKDSNEFKIFTGASGEEKAIKYLGFVCHEDPEMYFNKKIPIQHCPMDRVIEMIAEDGRIDDDEVVFEVSIGDSSKDRIITKADFCGLEGSDWRNNLNPRSQYVFVCVNDEDVDKGLLVAIEAQSVGDSILKIVRNEIDSIGEEEGDPEITPYAFKVVYDKNARSPKDYYTAYRYRRAALTAEISDLLNSDPIDVTAWLAPGNADNLRLVLEAHLKAKVDLDIAFDAALESTPKKSVKEAVPHDSHDESPLAETKKEKKQQTKKNENTTKQQKKEEPEEELIKCGVCEKMIPDVDICPYCKTNFNETDDDSNNSGNGICETCNGTGTFGKKKIECPDCGGSGLAEEPEEEETNQTAEEPENLPCETCNGTGKFGKKKIKCPDCGGTGITTEDTEQEPKEKPKPKPKTEKPKAPPQEQLVQCGVCKKMIPDVNICPECGTDFGDDDDDSSEEEGGD